MTRTGFLFIVLVAVAVTGCGVNTEAAPRRIDGDRLPDALVESPATSPTAAEPGAPSGTSFAVFLVRHDRVAPVGRVRRAVSVETRLDSLLDGPSQEEAAAGMRSAIPEGTRVTVVHTANGIATLAFAEEPAPTGPDQVLAVAQFVFTLTDHPGVSEVGFTVEGRQIGIPTRDGTISERPVGRGDFAGLVA